jgi:transcriptional regulator with XRE-family HTH domain
MTRAKKKRVCTAAQIRATRKKLGVTQETLAQMIGCSFTTVNRWENSQGAPGALHTIILDALRDAANNPDTGSRLKKIANTHDLSYTIYTLLDMAHSGKKQKHG